MDRIENVEIVEMWYPADYKTGQPKKYAQGLIINGQAYSWYEIEICYQFSREQYMRRRANNLTTARPKTEQEMLEAPFLQRKRDQKKSVSYGHSNEQLWANEVACTRWV